MNKEMKKEMSGMNYQTNFSGERVESNHYNAPQDEANLNLFHVTAKGIDENLLFTDAHDYGKIITISAICAFEYNIHIVAYSHMSNHSHYIIECDNIAKAERFMHTVKKRYSQFCQKKRGIRNIQRRNSINVKPIHSFSYFRNCIAYVLRNPVEARIVRHADQYEWSSFRCYFKDRSSVLKTCRPIHDFTKREIRHILGTHIDLTNSHFMIDSSGNIVPESFVMTNLVESIFEMSQEKLFWQMQKINYYNLEYELAYWDRAGNDDIELVSKAQELAAGWFKKELCNISIEEKVKLIGILYRKHHASQPQLCRILNLPKKFINQIVSTT